MRVVHSHAARPIPTYTWQSDELKHFDSSVSRHIAVYCRGSFYKLNVYDGSRLRSPDELEASLASLRRDAASRKLRGAEALIPALTGGNRATWAEVRDAYFSDGANKRALEMIESAAIYVVLTDATFDTADWTGRGKYLIGGQNDIWFDKSITLVVFADGKVGCNVRHSWIVIPPTRDDAHREICIRALPCNYESTLGTRLLTPLQVEHSWADAPVMTHMLEVAMVVGETLHRPYGEDGHVRRFDAERAQEGSPSGVGLGAGPVVEAWSRVPWSLSHDAEDAVNAAAVLLGNLRDDLDLQVNICNACNEIVQCFAGIAVRRSQITNQSTNPAYDDEGPNTNQILHACRLSRGTRTEKTSSRSAACRRMPSSRWQCS